MCAILHEKPVEQEAGYSGEPETVNLYQCGVLSSPMESSSRLLIVSTSSDRTPQS